VKAENFEIDYTIHTGEAAVKSAINQVVAIQARPQTAGGRPSPKKID